jgi:hypothetical protein
VTLSHLRRILHAELRYTQEEFEKHIQQLDCASERCLVHARFRERVRTLTFALNEAGGRVRDINIEPWGPVEGA